MQVDDRVGIYALPSCAIGPGIQINAAAIIDFTFDHQFTIGGGPEYSVVNPFNISSSSPLPMYEGRFRLQWHFAVGTLVETGRDSFTIGFDLAMLGGSEDGISGASSVFELAPMITLGASSL